MKLKDKLLELNKTYEEIRKEALSIVETIKPKVENITDAQIVQSLIEKKRFLLEARFRNSKKISGKL